MAGIVRQSAYSNISQRAINADSASRANSSISSSYAVTASVLLGSVVSASYAATASLLLGSVISASYARTASYSTTLGASLVNTDAGELKLGNSANTTISGITALTASLANTASYVTPYEGAWRSYTPVWTTDGTQPTLGNGSLTGAYKQIGKTCFVRLRLYWGTTTNSGTGTFYFSLPVSASTSWGIQMPVSILDNGNAWYQAIANGEYGGFTSKTALIGQSAGGANSSQGISGLFPFTFGNLDSIQFNGSYESI